MNDPAKSAVSVSELNAYIQTRLENDPRLVSVFMRAEISNFKTYSSGHCYFTLKDSKSMISGVMWGSYARGLSFRPKDGDEVLVHGRVAVYPPRGSYQFSCDHMELYGQGAELLRLQELKAKLAAEGLFDPSKKKPLPRFPKTVAVIAGKDSAGMKDIVVNLLRRWPLVRLLTYPSLVQGKDAPKDIIAKLGLAMNESPDVLILARGGGSSEDLSAFNDEELVRTLGKRTCPVISAVGHEIDTTLTDLVADLRVSTPTAAAVASVPDKFEIYQTLDGCADSLLDAVNGKIRLYRRELDSLSGRPFFTRPGSIYEDKLEKLALTSERLERAIQAMLEGKKHSLQRAQDKLEALNPRGVLTRGYTMTLDSKGKPITAVADLGPGDTLKTCLADGIIVSTIDEVRKGEA